MFKLHVLLRLNKIQACFNFSGVADGEGEGPAGSETRLCGSCTSRLPVRSRSDDGDSRRVSSALPPLMPRCSPLVGLRGICLPLQEWKGIWRLNWTVSLRFPAPCVRRRRWQRVSSSETGSDLNVQELGVGHARNGAALG